MNDARSNANEANIAPSTQANALALDAAVIEDFARNGAICLRGVFSTEWVDIVRRGIERNLAVPGPAASFADGSEKRFFQDSNNWKRIEEFEAFVRLSPARLIAAQLFSSRTVTFLHDHVLVKYAGATKPTPWHQDQPYSPVEGSQFCTMWMPVDPVPREAVLEFVGGSQRSGTWYRPQRFIDGSLRVDDDPRWALLPDIEADRPAWPILGWDVQPGDVLIFHGLTLHGAPGNLRDTPRRILSTRWLGDDARIRRRSGKMSPPLPDDAPADGEPFACEHFPLVWTDKE